MQENKKHPDWGKRSETVLLPDDMMLHIENPKESTKKDKN